MKQLTTAGITAMPQRGEGGFAAGGAICLKEWKTIFYLGTAARGWNKIGQLAEPGASTTLPVR